MFRQERGTQRNIFLNQSGIPTLEITSTTRRTTKTEGVINTSQPATDILDCMMLVKYRLNSNEKQGALPVAVLAHPAGK